jgi:hypothetical protein
VGVLNVGVCSASVSDFLYQATPNRVLHFIVSKDICHLKCFETVDETTPKIYDFILKFHSTKFYVVSLVIYEIK